MSRASDLAQWFEPGVCAKPNGQPAPFPETEQLSFPAVGILGEKLVYTASSQALAALEMLAHVEDRGYLRHALFAMIPVDIPEELIELPKRLPARWGQTPPRRPSQLFGDRFIAAAQFPALRVPSVVVPEEFNYLLNPAHPQFDQIIVGRSERFRFDPRLT